MTQRIAAGLLVATLTVGGCLAVGCLGDIAVDGTDTTPPMGQGGLGGMGGEGATTGEGGEEGCQSPPDGYCSEVEDCECSACSSAAACMDGGCMANGFCDLLFEDSCTCSDCDWDNECIDSLGGGKCVDDGTCARETESCACVDCHNEPTCLDNHELCLGGAPDGTCDPAVESCSCNDCLGEFVCLCIVDGACDFDEPCVCGDCWNDSFCSDPTNCTDDGECDWYFEGCACADCAANPQCNGFP